MEIIYLVIVLAVGFVVAWFISSSKIKKLSNENSKLGERSGMLEKEKEKTSLDLQQERDKVIELNASLSSLRSDYSNLQQKLTEQKAEIEKLQEKFTMEFENLANKIFEEKSTKFTEQNKEKLSEILNPLKEKISEFEKKVEETNKESIKGHASLREQLQMLKDMNQEITKEAKNLTEALKGQSKSQGNWGEFILESILEKSGLVKGREYVVQESITAESGKRFQPDVIIKLPENKSIVVDSKVSLNAYEKFISADNEKDQQLALRDHNISIRSHIKNLAGKNYQNLYQLESLDFVLMFMPIEPAFALAVQQDPQIFNEAFEQNIVIVSPSTLLATLKTIESIWRRENQNRNAVEIARQSGELLDKFTAFVDDLISVGKGLISVKDNYDKAMNKLTEGRGNLISRTEKIKQLGAKATKSLPPSILNRAELESDNE
ncbi:MAG: DNA recombination protein RmuC [Bacteroidetes bacterium]|nr:DNA recombination protein RmuC [Bacteroidota bacterium]MBU2584082.1 DNA recombination protein RmuC [Bacteroidota bacterium]